MKELLATINEIITTSTMFHKSVDKRAFIMRQAEMEVIKGGYDWDVVKPIVEANLNLIEVLRKNKKWVSRVKRFFGKCVEKR